MKFDVVLDKIGEFGRYQQRLFFILCIPPFIGAMRAMSVIFILDIPPHRCSLGENDTYAIQNEHHAHLVNMSIPWETYRGESVRSSCFIYTNKSLGSNETQACGSWVFDKSTYESTLTEKFSIVCENLIFRSHSNMASFVGLLVGSLVVGFLADRFGRRPLLLISAWAQAVVFIATAFVPNVYVFMILRAMVNMTGLGTFMTSFVLVTELSGPSKRVFVGIVIEIAWGLGLFTLGLIAYFVRSWFTLQLIISLPTVMYIGLYWIVPESPRWLISRGRTEEAQAIIKKIASVNRVEFQPEMLEKITVEENNQKTKLTEMFTNRSLFIMTMIIFFNWFAIVLAYYGLGLNVQNLSGEIYLNFTIANIMEMASYVLCVILLDRLGRKILHCACMVSGGLACLASIFPVVYGTSAHDWITVLLSMVGRFGASGAFAIIYVYTAELFPTVVRNSGLGSSSCFSRIGGMISPYVADLGVLIGGDLKIALPLIVFGAFSLVAGLLSLHLPETLGKKLPETIEDAKNFKKTGGKNTYNLNTNLQLEINDAVKLDSLKSVDDRKF